MQYKKFFVFVLVLAIVAVFVAIKTGADGRRATATLDRADSLIAVGQADSAYALLDSVRTEFDAARRRYRMRYRLLEAEAMNKTYQDFETDSVMLEVVKYYDRHGSSNERLRARYMLGSAYRDMGDMPQAITTWEDAVEDADTLSPDCNYSVLARVYGQMADVYLRQFLFDRQLEAGQNFCKYSLIAGDTISYIFGLIKRNDVYRHLGDTAAIWRNVEEVRSACRQFGREDLFARVYPTPIDLALNNKEFDKAREMMQIFERESGLFDSIGNIVKTGEKYYFNKGRYYIAMEQFDSAEYQFRRLLPTIANRSTLPFLGLMYVFENKKQYDSLLHYTELYIASVNNYLERTSTDAVVQAKSMYDYRRQQKIASEAQRESERLHYTLAALSVVFLSVLLFAMHFYRSKKKKNSLQIQQLMHDLDRTKAELQKGQSELTVLRDNLRTNDESLSLLSKKENEIQLLETRLVDYEQYFNKLKEQEKLIAFRNSDIVNRFYKMITPSLNNSDGKKQATPSSADWLELQELVGRLLPLFYSKISQDGLLTEQQFQVCLLLRLGFNTKETAILLQTYPSRISKVKSLANERLFGVSDAESLANNLKDIELPIKHLH